jgi:hypothetical protein
MRYAALLLLPMLVCGQQPAPASHDCAADGSVVNSLTGEPVMRAVVQITGAGMAAATSDNTGHWKVSGIGCGRVNISASKAGFLFSQQTRPRNAAAVLVSPDSPVHDFKVELMPQSVIAGRVVDDQGDPVQNVSVAVLTSRVLEGKRSFQQSGMGVTNDLGEYRIAGQGAGKVILCARAQNDMVMLQIPGGMILGESCYPGPPDGGAASAMQLAAGREARVDFTLTHIQAVHIRGKVTGVPEGRGVMVSLQPRSAVRTGAMTKQANMARDGNFDISGVMPGAWLLAVDYWEAGNRLFARVPVDVASSDLDGVTVHVEPGFPVTGTLRVESAAGRAPNLQQVNLGLRGTDVTSGTGTAQWDKERRAFTIADATPGTYALYVNAPAPFYLKSAMLGGRDLSREVVPILQAAGPIDVVLADDAGSIEGQLQDLNGEGVAGWAMAVKDGRSPVGVMTGPDGSFKISALSPGDYRVYGWDDFLQVEWGDADWMRRNAGSGVAVSVGAGPASTVKVVRVTTPRD